MKALEGTRAVLVAALSATIADRCRVGAARQDDALPFIVLTQTDSERRPVGDIVGATVLVQCIAADPAAASALFDSMLAAFDRYRGVPVDGLALRGAFGQGESTAYYPPNDGEALGWHAVNATFKVWFKEV